nr:unnamed protein product [Callosobruchus analis]
MQDQRAPKDVVNEGYLDQRDDPQKILTSSKRATTYTANVDMIQRQATTSKLRVAKVQCLSRSLIRISSCNSPRKSRDNDSNVRRNTSVVHLYQTESKSVKQVNKNINISESKGSKASKKDDSRRQQQRAKSKNYHEKKQRSWTLPVFSPKSHTKQKQTPGDNFDQTTYFYMMMGHIIDSSFLQTDRNEIMDQEPCTSMVITLCTMALERQFMVMVFIVVNQIIHIITTLFENLGKVLELPAQQVYQPVDNLWTLNRL